MTRKKRFLKITILLLFISCSRRNAVQHVSQFVLPETVPAIGYVIPADKVKPPIKIIARKPKVITAGKPIVISCITNVHISNRPDRKILCLDFINRDENSVKPPVIRKAVHHSTIAGVPEIVVAKVASFKDNDPEGFSSFKSLQGLRQPLIRCMMQDSDGNIWMGTYSGGISKYDGKYFTNYTIAQGLSNDGVWSIIQDHMGNIWMGTLGGGIIKYDGTSFTTYKTSDGLCDNSVYCLYEDDKKNMWIGTKNGVSCFNGKTFCNYFTEQGLPDDVIYSIAQDGKGNIWIGTNKGVAVFSGNSFNVLAIKESLSNKPINTILVDKANTIWFGAGDVLIKCDGNVCETYGIKQGLTTKNISSLCKDKRGNLWITSLVNGINKFDGKRFTHYTIKEGLSSNKVTSVLEDRSGTLWFGTSGGACRYDGNLFTHFTTQQGLAYDEVKGIAEDKAGNLWFATWGGGVSKYDGKNFENYSMAQGVKSNNLLCALLDSKGNFWFGADNGVSKYNGKTFANYDASQGFCNSEVWCIAEDKQQNIWLATFGDGVYKYDGSSFMHFSDMQGLGTKVVMCLLQDRLGNMWFGTYGKGIYKYDGKTLTNFTHEGGLSSDEVMDMMEDKEGNLWIGTIGGGVNKFNGKTFTHYSTMHGLSNEIVMGILQDRTGNLWFSTRNGFNRMVNNATADSKQNVFKPLFKKYMFEDGFLGVNAYVNALYQDKKNNIWIGTGDRLTRFTPDGEIPDTVAPTIRLTGLSLYNEKLNWQDLQKKKDTSLTLANGVEVKHFKFDSIFKWYNVPQHLSLVHNNNYLVFNYIGISMRSSYNIKYQYKLDGMEENWNALTDRTEATYGNIPYGKYTFKVKAMNSEGFWSNEYSYPFEIRAAWWQTWWFKTLTMIAVLAIIYGVYQNRLQQVLRLQKIRNKIAIDLHDDIGSTLNSISVYSEVAKNDPEKRNDSLHMIGESSRKVIDAMSDIVWTINPENDSFENIILRMRSLAFHLLRAKNIEFSFQADESLNRIKLPMETRRNFFLIFKETLNNLVKYSEATTANIQLLNEGSLVKLIVRDNGKGFDLSVPANGNGLNNMRHRAKEMKTQFKIYSAVGKGTQTELLLKL